MKSEGHPAKKRNKKKIRNDSKFAIHKNSFGKGFKNVSKQNDNIRFSFSTNFLFEFHGFFLLVLVEL